MRLLCVLAVFVTGSQGQSLHDLYGTDKFHRALFELDDGEVTFDTFQDVQWEAKARTALPQLTSNRPTVEQIARLREFESAGRETRFADFRAPLDPATRQAYLLIHDDGVTAIDPVEFKGTVMLDFDANIREIQNRATYGSIVGKTEGPVKTAAFVFSGKPTDVSDIHPAVRFEKVGTGYRFTEDGSTVSWAAADPQPQILSTLSFKTGGAKYLLVRWGDDDGILCLSKYTLFSVTTALTPIAGSFYNCDP